MGKYVFGDYSTTFGAPAGTLLGLEETSPNNWSLGKLTVLGGNPIPTRILAFGRDEQGEIYVAAKVTTGPSETDPNTGLPTGGIYKIVPPVTASVNLEPSKDTAIYQESPNNSSGQGFLFAGQVAGRGGNSPRRALLAFDLSALPAGALPTSAAVSLTMDRTVVGVVNFSLYKLTEDWGEGASNSGGPGGQGAPAQNNDATWSFRFYNQANPPASPTWTTAGGTFVGAPSATTSVDGIGVYLWSDSGLLTDVKSWLSNPAQNFGWILRGVEGAAVTAKRFVNREAATASDRPHLALSYASEPPLSRREQWLQQYFFVGQFVDDAGDLDGDGIRNLFEYAYAFSPLARNSGEAGLMITTAPSGANTLFTIKFRRDPRAIDLTYRVQTSDDLTTWTTIVESIGGATPSGTGFASEADAPGEAPVKVVTAIESLSSTHRFARLQVVRVP